MGPDTTVQAASLHLASLCVLRRRATVPPALLRGTVNVRDKRGVPVRFPLVAVRNDARLEFDEAAAVM
jgi:hypothetical protein